MNIVPEPIKLDESARIAQQIKDLFPAGTMVAVLIKPRNDRAFVLTDSPTDKVRETMQIVPGDQFWPLDIGD